MAGYPQAQMLWKWGQTSAVKAEIDPAAGIGLYAPVVFDGRDLLPACRVLPDAPPGKRLRAIAEMWLGAATVTSQAMRIDGVRYGPMTMFINTRGVYQCWPTGGQIPLDDGRDCWVGFDGRTFVQVDNPRLAIGRRWGTSAANYYECDETRYWAVELGIGGPRFISQELIMSNALTLQQKVATVRQMFQTHKAQIEMALPRHVSVDRLMRVALTAVQRTPQLLECDQRSLFGAVIQAAQLGLDPDGVLGQAYLVPYRNKKRGTTEVQLIPGYKGLMELARRSGHVTTFAAEVVQENDKFDLAYGLDPRLNHIPSRTGDRGAITGAYAVARMRSGDVQFVWLTKTEIDEIRDASPSSRSGPWKTHYKQMMKKTAIRRLCKLLPVSVEMERIEDLDRRSDDGISQDLGAIIDIGEVVEETAETEPPTTEPPKTTPAVSDEGPQQNGGLAKLVAEYRVAIEEAKTLKDVNVSIDAAATDIRMPDDATAQVATWGLARKEEIRDGRGEQPKPKGE